MADHVTDDADVDRLVEEISCLRGQVAQLQERVEQLDHLAHQDSLIDLPNRRGFLRELERLIARVSRYDAKGAMLFVDVDGLKAINDSFGHRAGDEALIEVAELLASGVRKSDVVARIGGDEFGILLENADEQSAHETASRLIDLIAACEFLHDGNELPLSVAIGVGLIDASDTAETVMARADQEMYRRKAAA
ncbi:MAG TPA: GGDEF domain-containing protein [Sphingomicrobium sp.]|nr:GGDEF domain-containing protein [Sphingomicrobium sp.]